MDKVEQTPERLNWLQSLQIGDLVKLETLLGYYKARIQKRANGRLTVRIIAEQDKTLDGWEVKIKESDGIGHWPHNIIHPIDEEPPETGQDELVLVHIGDAPKDVPLQGWESA